jgi:protein tyrosine/serine phosphatase
MWWWVKRGAAAAGLGLCGVIAFAVTLYMTDNYHTVIAGELYRSAQLTPVALAEHQAQDGFKSVLNLRGASPQSDWYQDELRVSAELGLQHADFKLSARREVTPEEVRALVGIMRALPKPILIHCLQGADRTGFTVAMYLAAIKGAGHEVSEAQLSVRYGHLGIPYLSETYPMDISWEREEVALGFED